MLRRFHHYSRSTTTSSIKLPVFSIIGLFSSSLLCFSSSSSSSSSLFRHSPPLLRFSHNNHPKQYQEIGEQRKWDKQQKTQDQVGSTGIIESAPHPDHATSPLIKAVYAELFRLCTTPHPVITSPTAAPSNPHWVNIGLITKNLPDDLLEEELEKFSNGGIREVIGKYLAEKKVELKFDEKKKMWFARTEPIDDDLVKMSDLTDIILADIRKSFEPMQIGRFGTILKNPLTHGVLPAEAAQKFFTPKVQDQCKALYNRLLKKHDKSLMRIVWRCFLYVPTCRWDVIQDHEGTTSSTMLICLVRDKFMRSIHQPKTSRLQIDQLREVVPTFFIPMEKLLELIQEKGYTEEHVKTFFNLSNNMQIVTLPINNKSYVRLHGGVGEYPMWGSLSTNAQHQQYDPLRASRCAKQYIKLLQEYFKRNVEAAVKEREARVWQQQQQHSTARNPFSHQASPATSSSSLSSTEEFDYIFSPSEINEMKWCSLRKLIEAGGSELEQQIPMWRGPEAILFFAQLQHLFCFTPGGVPDGGFVSLQPYFYPSFMDVDVNENHHYSNENNNNKTIRRRVKLPVTNFSANNPRLVMDNNSHMIAQELNYITPLPIQSLGAEECPCSIFVTELGTFLKKKRRNPDDPDLNKSAGLMELLTLFNSGTGTASGAAAAHHHQSSLRSSSPCYNNSRRNAHYVLPDVLDPIFDLAQPEFVVPFEEQPNHFLYNAEYSKKRKSFLSPSRSSSSSLSPVRNPHHALFMMPTSTSADEGVKERHFEDYIRLLCRLHHRILVYDIEERRVIWASAAHLRVRLRLPLQDQLRLAQSENAPMHRIRALQARSVREQDPQNPWWDTGRFFTECVVNCIPTDRYCTVAEFYNHLLPRQYFHFVPSVGVYPMFRRHGPKNGIVMFHMTKPAHYENVMRQHGYTTIEQLKQNVPLDMFETFPNCRIEGVRDYFICVMRLDGEYYKRLVLENDNDSTNNHNQQQQQGIQSSSSSSAVSSLPHSHNLQQSQFQQTRTSFFISGIVPVLPPGAIPLEATSEQLARIVVDILIRFGETVSSSVDDQQTHSTKTTTVYRMKVQYLRERLPLLRLAAGTTLGRDMNDMQSFIAFLEKHPDKFFLISSGKIVNQVVLQPEYLTEMMMAKQRSHNHNSTDMNNSGNNRNFDDVIGQEFVGVGDGDDDDDVGFEKD